MSDRRFFKSRKALETKQPEKTESGNTKNAKPNKSKNTISKKTSKPESEVRDDPFLPLWKRHERYATQADARRLAGLRDQERGSIGTVTPTRSRENLLQDTQPHTTSNDRQHRTSEQNQATSGHETSTIDGNFEEDSPLNSSDLILQENVNLIQAPSFVLAEDVAARGKEEVSQETPAQNDSVLSDDGRGPSLEDMRLQETNPVFSSPENRDLMRRTEPSYPPRSAPVEGRPTQVDVGSPPSQSLNAALKIPWDQIETETQENLGRFMGGRDEKRITSRGRLYYVFIPNTKIIWRYLRYFCPGVAMDTYDTKHDTGYTIYTDYALIVLQDDWDEIASVPASDGKVRIPKTFVIQPGDTITLIRWTNSKGKKNLRKEVVFHLAKVIEVRAGLTQENTYDPKDIIVIDKPGQLPLRERSLKEVFDKGEATYRGKSMTYIRVWRKREGTTNLTDNLLNYLTGSKERHMGRITDRKTRRLESTRDHASTSRLPGLQIALTVIQTIQTVSREGNVTHQFL